MTPSPSLYRQPFRHLFCLACVLLGAGCASVPDVENRLQGLQFHPNLYVVQANDTIDSIAWRYRLSPTELVALNPGLENGPRPGQRLNVVPGTQLSDAVREGRSIARVDADGRLLDDGMAPADGWSDPYPAANGSSQGGYADAYGQSANDLPYSSVPAGQDVYRRTDTARPAPVEPQPRIEVRRLEDRRGTWTDGRQMPPSGYDNAPAADDWTRQPPVADTGAPQSRLANDAAIDTRAGQPVPTDTVAADTSRGATGPVVAEVRASVRGPTDEMLLDDSPATGEPDTSLADSGQSSAADEQLAMVSPDAGGWPREEIVPDDLDFAPVQNGSGQATSDAGFSGRWSWPTDGQIVRGFQPDRVGGQGVDIAGVPGQDVKAAMDGTVVYSGRDLSGEGNLIILRHPDDLLSTYSHTRNLYVAEDDVVRAGDSIASLGANENQESVLGFEIRRDGNPLNPLDFLPVP